MKKQQLRGSDVIRMAFDENGEVAGGEVRYEDCIKKLADSANCNLLKFYHTDGFGPYINHNRVMFVLNESKIIHSKDVFNQALTQSIIYYIRIKNGEYGKFPMEISDLAWEYNYLDVRQFVIDRFGCFLLSCNHKLIYVPVYQIQSLIENVEIILKENPKITPSECYKKIKCLKTLMLKVDLTKFQSNILDTDYATSDLENIFNNIMDGIDD